VALSALRVLAFCSGDERYLVRLDGVRAVVRLRGLRRLPGSGGALVGVLDVQETPVAIYDTRPALSSAARPDTGDVMVLAAGWPQHAVGVACDRVDGLLELPELGGLDRASPRPPGLPSYVEALLRVDDALLPLVDVIGLAEAGGTL
jgi:chemotaxis signal transduction protein